ncbi:ion channel [Leptolyngbya sp. Heron Island J]|uniref:potassium channel family protein n=1 Tax=Leptolyngbya sp. Heron Island J TaxID=1385935 RepID=UPI0003B9CEFE|nr:potassium channel family protein [Leptolyngbya sp. Heron Island J]ESA33947.1 ion channel [Leptolyngbya sp. Heron Island J]
MDIFRKAASPPQYNQLLAVTVVRLLVIPFADGGWGDLLASFLLFHISFLIIRSYRLSRLLFVLIVAISFIGFLLDIFLTFSWLPTSSFFLLTVQGIYSFFFSSAVLLILKNILQASRVTSDTVKGGVCVYLLLGYLWALFYSIIYTLNANAFSSALVTETSRLRVLYFSFVILTTLGFGDITPVSEAASVMTILEALIGQVYPAVFMALLVSSYLAHRESQDNPPSIRNDSTLEQL